MQSTFLSYNFIVCVYLCVSVCVCECVCVCVCVCVSVCVFVSWMVVTWYAAASRADDD